jgi:hypothetical protein
MHFISADRFANAALVRPTISGKLKLIPLTVASSKVGMPERSLVSTTVPDNLASNSAPVLAVTAARLI